MNKKPSIDQLETQIQRALNQADLRKEALKQAIATVRKCPYGAGSGESMVKLAKAYYLFLIGGD